MMFDKLSAPFPVDAIHWRAQSLTKEGDKALALAYIDARDVMDRLDAVCGPAGWQDSYTETPKGRLICTLSIFSPDGVWISKSDGAGDTDVEGDKGAISDALKRAAVKWGIGRYLYGLKDVWAPCQSKEVSGKLRWSKWHPAAGAAFKRALQSAVPVELPTGPINDKTRDWLAAQIDATGIPVAEFCKAFDATSLKAITYEQMEAARQWTRDNRKAA
jgi:hypothetical protein